MCVFRGAFGVGKFPVSDECFSVCGTRFPLPEIFFLLSENFPGKKVCVYLVLFYIFYTFATN